MACPDQDEHCLIRLFGEQNFRFHEEILQRRYAIYWTICYSSRFFIDISIFERTGARIASKIAHMNSNSKIVKINLCYKIIRFEISENRIPRQHLSIQIRNVDEMPNIVLSVNMAA